MMCRIKTCKSLTSKSDCDTSSYRALIVRMNMILNHNDCRNRRWNPDDKCHHQARQLDSITDHHITLAAWSPIHWKGDAMSDWKLFELATDSPHVRRKDRDIPSSDRRISDSRLMTEVQIDMIKQR